MNQIKLMNASDVDRIAQVDFYQGQGSCLVDKPNPELCILEPEDIHMFIEF